MNKSIQKNIVPGVIFLSVALFFWFITPGQVPTRETSSFNAQTFPRITLLLIMACSIGLIISGAIQILRDKKVDEQSDNKSNLSSMQARDIIRVLLVLGLLILSAVIGSVVGLLIAGLVVVVGMLLIFGVKKKQHYLIVITAVIVSYFLFKFLFGLNLP